MTALFDKSKKHTKPVERKYGSPFGEKITKEQLARIRQDVIMSLGSKYKAKEYERMAGAGPDLKERATEIAYKEFLEGG